MIHKHYFDQAKQRFFVVCYADNIAGTDAKYYAESDECSYCHKRFSEVALTARQPDIVKRKEWRRRKHIRAAKKQGYE